MTYSDTLLLTGLMTSLGILVVPALVMGFHWWRAERREARRSFTAEHAEERRRPPYSQAA